ncbi:MAG: phage tail protein [Bacteroidota bacterium]
MAGEIYQTVGFHFSVYFHLAGFDSGGIDTRFQSVSGLDIQMETESLKEGGENSFEHVLPVRRKYADLILKRGLLSPDSASEITKWFKQAFEEYNIEPIDLDVELLNENHEVLMKWKVIHAWPKNWKIGELNAERGEVLIETLELNYNRYVFESP